jgi:hypothetical protein
MKKVLGLLLAMAMLMSLAGSALAETNKFGWEVPAETLKVTVFIASDNWTELEEQKQGIASMKDYLLKNFNIELNYQTTDGDAEEAVNLMLASGEYPDVIKGLTTASRQKFVDQGRAVVLLAAQPDPRRPASYLLDATIVPQEPLDQPLLLTVQWQGERRTAVVSESYRARLQGIPAEAVQALQAGDQGALLVQIEKVMDGTDAVD